MSQERSDDLELSPSKANISSSSLVVEYSRLMGVATESTSHTIDENNDRTAPSVSVERATSGHDEAGKKLQNTECCTMRRASCDSTKESAMDHHGIIHEEPLEIQCGEKTALLFVSKLCQGSKGPCILYGNDWLTPNELQYICGRETAKDWKRSIRHKGKSLKSLIAQGFLKVHPPICDCPGCRVSSPVNRSRLADKCGFSKIPSYLTEKSMVEGFPTMWRRSSTSSDEPEQQNVLQGSENFQDDDSQPKRAHSDEPRYYQPSEPIHVTKRPRSSSPDLDRGRLCNKRRCMSETFTDNHGKLESDQSQTNQALIRRLPNVEDFKKQERKCKMTEQELKREQMRLAGSLRTSLVKDLPVLTLPSTAYPANVLYAHNQAHLNLHRHVTSPRLLSPSFVRPTSTASPQIRLLHEQAVASPLSSHIYAQQLRQEYPNVGMATMFPYSFNHPLPSNQILSTHYQKVTPEMERHIANTRDTAGANVSPNMKEEKTKLESKGTELCTGEERSPGSVPISSPKGVDPDKSRQSSVEEAVKFESEDGEEQSARVYPELAQIAAQWDIEEVCKFVNSVTGCSEYSDVFREQEIDGQALILLTEDHLSNKMGIKLGPALKIKSKIDELRCLYSK